MFTLVDLILLTVLIAGIIVLVFRKTSNWENYMKMYQLGNQFSMDGTEVSKVPVEDEGDNNYDRHSYDRYNRRYNFLGQRALYS